jgi:DNA-binding response OmpR family regulator
MAQTKPRILYVDEDAEDGFTLTTLLRLASYEPVTTNYASDALQLARSADFDLYVLGRRFPADSGEYLCRKLRQIAPRTPVIFLPDDDGKVLEAVGRALSPERRAAALSL